MKNIFCEYCMCNTDSEYKENLIKEKIDNYEIEYIEKYYICTKCKNKIYDNDTLDYNIRTANNELRKQSGLIRISEIEEIMEKYDIGKKPLSLVLGFGEITIIRYLEGTNPSKENSDLLKLVLNNPEVFEMILLNNKEKISNLAYRKSLSKTKQLEMVSEHSKLYQVSLYILEKYGATTPLGLQKILYFINGFSKKFLGTVLFNDSPQAWTHGPVYPDIYSSFCYYYGEKIEFDEVLKDYEFNLTKEEKSYIDKITKYFACFSPNYLVEMSHLTTPWIEARKGLKDDESTDRIIDNISIETYFEKIISDFNIENESDVSKYTQNLLDIINSEE